jgi:hypothetical protein
MLFGSQEKNNLRMMSMVFKKEDGILILPSLVRCDQQPDGSYTAQLYVRHPKGTDGSSMTELKAKFFSHNLDVKRSEVKGSIGKLTLQMDKAKGESIHAQILEQTNGQPTKKEDTRLLLMWRLDGMEATQRFQVRFFEKKK